MTKSIRDAIDAGALYDIEDANGKTIARYQEASTVDDAILRAVTLKVAKPGQRVAIYRHLPSSRIGAGVLELAWEGNLP